VLCPLFQLPREMHAVMRSSKGGTVRTDLIRNLRKAVAQKKKGRLAAASPNLILLYPLKRPQEPAEPYVYGGALGSQQGRDHRQTKVASPGAVWQQQEMVPLS
jgi:hypothetical protein